VKVIDSCFKLKIYHRGAKQAVSNDNKLTVIHTDLEDMITSLVSISTEIHGCWTLNDVIKFWTNHLPWWLVL